MILESDSELEGDLSQCSSLVEESEADALPYSPIKVLALTFQGYIGRTYIATTPNWLFDLSGATTFSKYFACAPP